jgi:hypothetical protein
METFGQIVAGVYTLLRRPSEAKLPPADVRERLNDRFKRLVQEHGLSMKGSRTVVAPVTVSPSDVDFRIDLENIPDYEVLRLERGASYVGGETVWDEVAVVPFESWEQHFSGPRLAATFYGGPETGGVRVKLNATAEEMARWSWRLSYRLPLLIAMQSGDRPPLPSHFLPMAKLEGAIACAPLVNDQTPEWKGFLKTALPLYMTELQDWREQWTKYLDTTLEPQSVPVPPFNWFRRGHFRINPRAYLPIGEG